MTDPFVDRLRTAFPPEPISGDAAFADWGGSYPDAAVYARAIDGKTWEQLDRELIVRRHDALGFLSSRELVQVLPIYLLSLVEQGVMSSALDAVLVKLTRPTSEQSRSRFDQLLKTLTAEQRAVIAAALRHIVERDPDGSPGRAARAALADVWEESK